MGVEGCYFNPLLSAHETLRLSDMDLSNLISRNELAGELAVPYSVDYTHGYLTR
jgi:hypothetical protein